MMMMMMIVMMIMIIMMIIIVITCMYFISIFMSGLMLDDSVFENPTEFYPQRWLTDDQVVIC